MTLSEKYEQIVKSSQFNPDDSQRYAITQLDELQTTLVNQTHGAVKWWQKFITHKTMPQPEGLYFWGGVGRGKTFLMDIFYQSLPFEEKKRLHFHAFMNQVHHALKHVSDQPNPLDFVAKDLAKDMRVLCLDEFVVTDIADAMILSGLIKVLFESGVVLVATSNSPPYELYREGLQRARFMPTIDLISKYCRVIQLDGGTDYRLLGLKKTHLYTVPHSSAVVDEVNHYLSEHVPLIQVRSDALNVNGRDLEYQFYSEDTVWFDFEALCKTNRSQNDYLELARLFKTLILTDIEPMDHLSDDVAKRFILLIDILYDHHVILICSAAVLATQLYQGKRLAFEFERTISRLIEMQSEQYLMQAHRRA